LPSDIAKFNVKKWTILTLSLAAGVADALGAAELAAAESEDEDAEDAELD
jgi:hypothetical protein